MKEYKIAVEAAEQEFETWADAMDIDTDESLMDDEDRKGFTKARGRFITAVRAGALVLNDDDEAVYTPQKDKSRYKEAITFHERTGASLMAMDGQKKNSDVRKTFAIMADMTKLPAKTFAGLVGVDIKTCESIFLLLMD